MEKRGAKYKNSTFVLTESVWPEEGQLCFVVGTNPNKAWVHKTQILLLPNKIDKKLKRLKKSGFKHGFFQIYLLTSIQFLFKIIKDKKWRQFILQMLMSPGSQERISRSVDWAGKFIYFPAVFLGSNLGLNREQLSVQTKFWFELRIFLEIPGLK